METLESKNLYLNKPQLRLIMANASESMINWPRGIGKSFIIAWIIRLAALKMPRCSGTITGMTYEQILSQTLPATIQGLEKLGWKKDVHFWVRQEPPKKYKIPRPYQAPGKYDHYLTTYTGAGFHLLSQDKNAAPGRGLSTDIQITDEHLLIDVDRYGQEVLSTNRGNEEFFSKVNMHHGIYNFTSMPFEGNANHILKKSEYYDEDGYDFTLLKNQIIKLQLEFLRNKNVKHRLEISDEIIDLDKQLRFYKCIRPENKDIHNTYYSEATAWDNLINVGIRYLEKMYRDMIPQIFAIEMLGQRQKKIIGGFYPTFDREKHGYKGHYNYSYLDSLGMDFARIKNKTCKRDLDCDPDQELHISVDWGTNINFMVVAQHIEAKNQFNFINNLYAKHPEILDDVFNKFCDYYEAHTKKKVKFYFDKNGNQKLANSKITFAEQGAAILRKRGWIVEMKSLGGNNPFHNEKYLLLGRLFKQAHLEPSQRDPEYPTIMFNLIQCKETVISMEQAPAKEHGQEIKKNKKSENSSITPQEEATHASDAVDNILFPKYKHLLKGRLSIPAPMTR